ncbi:MAG: hypothetical protein IJZ60_09585 [Bacteroides sp.]|nr:hypothetical protein [Bacteroides sp.]
MKKKQQAMETYEAPKVEVIEVQVEQGFATSGIALDGSSNSVPVEGNNSTGSFPWP